MTARLLSGLAAGAVLWAAAGTALSTNSVRIQSEQVAADASEMAVGVYIANDRDVTMIVLPLELRGDTPGGCFIDAFDLALSGRVANSGLSEVEVRRLCGTAAPDNRCSGPISHTWRCPEQPDLPQEFFTSPSGVMWVGMRLTGMPLSPGIDAPGRPSVTLTFGLPYALGRFEIDTCCMTPSNHLAFAIIPSAGEPGMVVLPEFTRGVVTIVAPPGMNPPRAICRDPVISLRGGQTCQVTAEEVDGGSYDPDGDPLTRTLTPHGPFPAGVHVLQFVVNDGLLADTCTAVVTVVANQPPVALCRDFRLRPGHRCDQSLFPADIDAGSYDPDGDALTLTTEPEGAYPAGETTARLIVSDGQFADTCEAVVIVEDDVVLPFVCPSVVGPDYDEYMQPRIPDMSRWIALCPGADEMTFAQSPAAGWFLAPGFDTVTVTGVARNGESYPCRVALESPGESPAGAPPLPLSAVAVDIMPESCPNVLSVDCDVSSPPPLVVVISGSEDFDVTNIKPQTIRIGGVPKNRWYVHNVAASAPRHPQWPCACNEPGGDRYADMVFEFDVCEVLAAVAADTANDLLALVLTAELMRGGSISGGDCLRLRRPDDIPDPDSTDQLPRAILPLENYPNPFNSGTVIHFGLGQGGPVEVEIFDILGRRVRALTAGTRQSGPHQVAWNGCDDSGRPLASGLYLCRLSAPARREVRKMVLLR